MKIVSVQDLHADGGWRKLSFLKVTTDAGIVGWSEFNEGSMAPGLTAAIRALGDRLVGDDPCQINRIVAKLRAGTRIFAGGVISLAIAALENACWDIKAKSLGVPVHQLLGGALSERLPVYWSQCGTLRTTHCALFDAPPLRTLQDVVALGREARDKGYTALKTNLLTLAHGTAQNYRPGFGAGSQHPSLNLDCRMVGPFVDVLLALREGAGVDMGLMLDLNFNLKPEGIRCLARALEALDLTWLECDIPDPQALAELRRSIDVPVASLETMLGRQALRPHLEASAVDVAIIDAQWNGLSEAVKMASMAESFQVNVASHNYHGQLSTLIGAHFSASLTNNRIVEFVVDEAPWTRSFVTTPIRIEQGELVLPTGPGWGTDIDEAAVRAYPPRH